MKSYIFVLILLVFQTHLSYANYIDTRDLSDESRKIQRLLGKIDALKITPQQNNSPSGAQVAALTMITTGLAIAAVSSPYYHSPSYYHRSSYNRRSSYYAPRSSYHRRNTAGSIIGATVATAGIIGAIAASAEQDNRERSYIAQERAQKEVNTIISNLVVTDTDYMSEDKELLNTYSIKIDKNILEINRILSNEILLIEDRKKQEVQEFSDKTNKLQTELTDLQAAAQEQLVDNIDKISDPSISKEAIKELKKLNKTIKSESKKKVKTLEKQLEEEEENFNESFEEKQEKYQEQILELEYTRVDRIVVEAESMKEPKAKLFQKYISLYINKLSAY